MMPGDIQHTVICTPLRCVKYFVQSIVIVCFLGVNLAHAQSYQYHARSGNVDDWELSAQPGVEAQMFTVLDKQMSKRVLMLKGQISLDFSNVDSKPRSTEITTTIDSAAADTSVIGWMYKTNKPFRFEFTVETNKGSRALVYTDSTTKIPKSFGLTILYGLGDLSISNRWVKVARDIQKDLQRVDPDLVVNGVKHVSIVGDGLLRSLDVQHPLFNYSNSKKTLISLAGNQSSVDAISASLPAQNELTVTPIATPAIKTANGVLSEQKNPHAFKLKSYLVAGRNVYSREGEFERDLNYAGFSANYFGGDFLHLFLDVYPDFSLVEEKLNDIDFDYNEKEREDLREFFQNDTSRFGQNSDYFYSLRVPNFDYGFKTYVNQGASQVGALVLVSPDNRKDTHVKYSYGLKNSNHLSIEGVASSRIGLEHQLLGLMVNHAFANHLFVNTKGSFAQNSTTDEDSQGGALSLNIGWASGAYSFSVLSDYYDTDYDPVNAFLNSDRPGTRSHSLNGSYYKAGAGNLRDINASVSLSQRNTLSGDLQSEGGVVTLGALLFDKAQVQLDFNQNEYRALGDEPGLFVDEVNLDEFWSANVDVTNTRIGYGLSFSDGMQAGGDYRYRSTYLWFKPMNDLSFTLFNEELLSFGEFTQNSIEADWLINPRQNIRAKYSNGDNYQQWRLGFEHKFNKGHKFYVAYQKLTETEDELIGKFSWILQ